MRTQLSPEEVQERLVKLERANRQLKVSAVALLLLCAFGISSLLCTTARAQTAKAPAAVRPEEIRVATLESLYRSLSLRVNLLQSEVSALRTVAIAGGSSRTDVSDLRDDVDTVKEKTSDLESDVDRLKSETDDIDSIKSNVDDVQTDVRRVKDDMETLNALRKAICSFSWNASADLTLHTGYPVPCPAF